MITIIKCILSYLILYIYIYIYIYKIYKKYIHTKYTKEQNYK